MKRFLSFILAMLMVATLFVPSFAAAEDTGMSFSENTLHPLQGEFASAPMTIEARIHIPAGVEPVRGIIFSNNVPEKLATKPNLINLELMLAYVRLTYVTKTGAAKYVYFAFNQADHQGKTVHIAVVNAGTGFRAYFTPYGQETTEVVGFYGAANGKTIETSPATPEEYAYSKTNNPKTFYVGGEKYSDNSGYFRYHISELAVYSDARSATEIAADANSITKADNMLAWLQLSNASMTNGAPDLSGNGHHMGVQAGVNGTPVFKTYATVTFNSDGGTPVAEQIVAVNDEAANPGTPSKTGYKFLGWFAPNATESYNFTTSVTTNLTLTAKWEAKPASDPTPAPAKGLTFSKAVTYPTAKDFDKAPLTFEAVIRVTTPQNKGRQAIFSNYNWTDPENGIVFVLASTCVELIFGSPDGNQYEVKFAEINPKNLTNQWLHIAVVRDDANGVFRAYLNGEPAGIGETCIFNTTTKVNGMKPYGYTPSGADTFFVGGDTHGKTNSWYFTHEIAELAVYSDVRTAAEIKADAADITKDDNMLVWYRLSDANKDTGAEDLSGNGNHMGDYVDPNAPAPEPDPENSENPFASPLFALAARYAQRFNVELIGENCTITGDTTIKYKRSGVVEIAVDEGYEIVDVVLNGEVLGPVTKVDIKKVTQNPELLVITRAVGTAN